MRALQDLLIMVGATALGAVWGCLAFALLGALTVFRARSGEDWGTLYGVIAVGLCCGLPLGAMAGFAGAHWIIDEGGEDWGPAPWAGVVLGVVLGMVGFWTGAGRLTLDWQTLTILGLIAAASGTVGGMLAASAEAIWSRAVEGRSAFFATASGILLAICIATLLLVLASLFARGRWTGFQLTVAFLVGAPILFGAATWLRAGRTRGRLRKRKGPSGRFHDDFR